MIHSYSSIHQIFYPNKKFGPEEISQLQKYCLVNKLLQKIEESKSSKLSEKIKQITLFKPTEGDNILATISIYLKV